MARRRGPDQPTPTGRHRPDGDHQQAPREARNAVTMDETLKRPAASATAAAFVPASTPFPHRPPAARLAPRARIGARHRLGGRANATMDAIYREMVKFG